MLNNEYNRGKSELDGINIGYGMDETDEIEDDKLLKSLEKRFKNLDDRNNNNNEYSQSQM